MDLHAVTKLPHMLVKRGFEPTFTQAASLQPFGSTILHFLYDGAGVDVWSAEQFERPRGTSALRKRCSLQHDCAGIGASHPEIGCIGAGVDPSALA